MVYVKISLHQKYYQLNKSNLSTQLTIGLSSNNLLSEQSMRNIPKDLIKSISDINFKNLLGSGEFACMNSFI